MANEPTTDPWHGADRPDYWDGYHQAMLGHDRKLEGGMLYQRGYNDGLLAFRRVMENQNASE